MKKRWRKIPGIGKAIAAKIKELAETGSLKFFEELRAEFPGAILELFSIPGIGREENQSALRKTARQLDRGTAIGLRERKSGGASRLRKNDAGKTLPGDRDARETQRLVSTWQIAAEAESLQTDLRAHPDALQVCVAGSYRRHKEIVRDLDFIVATKEPAAITKSFIEHPLVESVIAQGRPKAACVCAREFNAICVWSPRPNIRSRSIILPGARSTTS